MKVSDKGLLAIACVNVCVLCGMLPLNYWLGERPTVSILSIIFVMTLVILAKKGEIELL